MTLGKDTRRGFPTVTDAAVFGLATGERGSAAPVPRPEDAAPQGAFDVREFGSKGDGNKLDPPAINKAIDAAATAGGTRCSSPREPICAIRSG